MNYNEVDSNIHFIQQGIQLLEELSDEEYSKNEGVFYNSGVGKHFRHIIDHYLTLVNRTGNSIDYDDRDRDKRVESNREFAITILHDLIAKLEKLNSNPENLNELLSVKSNEGIENTALPFSNSSVRRELQFLISHTVHHYALIGFIVKSFGKSIPDGFGVAPSTLKYERGINKVKA